jgi:hypothetical protein
LGNHPLRRTSTMHELFLPHLIPTSRIPRRRADPTAQGWLSKQVMHLRGFSLARDQTGPTRRGSRDRGRCTGSGRSRQPWKRNEPHA